MLKKLLILTHKKKEHFVEELQIIFFFFSFSFTLGFQFPLRIWWSSVGYPRVHKASPGVLLVIAISLLSMPDGSCMSVKCWTTTARKPILPHTEPHRDKDYHKISIQDSYHQLTRSDQTTIFRLRTGHNRLNQHLNRVMKIISSPMCSCGEAEQDTSNHYSC